MNENLIMLCICLCVKEFLTSTKRKNTQTVVLKVLTGFLKVGLIYRRMKHKFVYSVVGNNYTFFFCQAR